MSKKGENIYKRKDGRWEGRYIKGRSADGKAKYAYVYGKSYADTKQKLIDKRVIQNQNINHFTSRAKYGDILRNWVTMSRVHIKESTYSRYIHLANAHILPYLGEISTDRLTTQIIEKHISFLLNEGRLDKKGGLAPKTVSDILTLIKGSIDYANCSGISINCYLDRLTVKKVQIDMRVLSVNERHKLCEVLMREMNLTKFGVLLCMYTGIRIGEVCALKWESIDFSEGILSIRETLQRIQATDVGACKKTKIVITEPKSKKAIRDIPLPNFVLECAASLKHDPKEAETFDRPGGEYYKAYYELIQNIHPETQKSKAITPHIDRWWHVISKLPDLDEGSQAMQESRINTAFFWGMLAQYVHLEKENAATMMYKPDRNALNLKGDDGDTRLIVSNGTPCDHLYEVLDAFTIYPKLVSVVNEKIRARIENDLCTKTPLKDSVLFELLERFRVEEYELHLEDGCSGIRSIFDLPMLMKRSVPAEEYHEDSMIKLLDTIFNELKAYISRFCNKKEFPGIYADLIEAQFRLFINNTEHEKDSLDDICNDSLFIYICKAIAKEFDDYHMRDKSIAVLDVLRDLGR